MDDHSCVASPSVALQSPLCSGLPAALVQGVHEALAGSLSMADRGELQRLSGWLAQRHQTLADALAAALEPAAQPPRRAASGLAPVLALVDDRQVELDIEVMRVAQRMRDAAEWEVREHEALLASLPHRQRGHDALAPLACVKALVRAFEQLGLDHQDMLRLLRSASAALAAWFHEHHAEQARRLREHGARPGPFTVVVGGKAAAAPAPREGAAAPAMHAPLPAALRAAHGAAPVGLGLLLQCLQTRPTADSPAAPSNALPAASQAALIERLQGLLQAPGESQADDEAPVPQSAHSRDLAPAASAAVLLPPLHVPQAQQESLPANFRESVQRRKLEAILRRQIRAQLRDADVKAGLRSFLLEPWVHALTETLLHHGPDSPVTRRIFDCSDQIIERVAPPGGPHDGSAAPKAPDALESWLDTVREALGLTLLPPERVQALATLLVDLLPHAAPANLPSATSQADSADCADCADTCTATEPDWIDTLEPGQWLLLQIESQWAAAELLWHSANRQFFLFGSRHAGRTHSISRRTLLQMRADARIEWLDEAPAGSRPMEPQLRLPRRQSA